MASQHQANLTAHVSAQNEQGRSQQTAQLEQALDQARATYKAAPGPGPARAFAAVLEYTYVAAVTRNLTLPVEELLGEARGYLAEAARSTPAVAPALVADEGFLLIVLGKKDEARRVLGGRVNPHAVPYLAFLLDEAGETAEVVALCKQGLAAARKVEAVEVRMGVIESCSHFTRSTSEGASLAWATKADLRAYARWRDERVREIAAAANDRAASEERRCAESAKTTSTFSSSGAYAADLRCARADAALEDRYISSVEAILSLAPRTIKIRSQCARPVSIYVGSAIPDPSLQEVVGAGAEVARELRAQDAVTLLGATSGAGSTIPVSPGIREIEIAASCVTLAAK